MKLKETIGITFLVVGLIFVINNCVEILGQSVIDNKLEFYLIVGVILCVIGYLLNRD